MPNTIQSVSLTSAGNGISLVAGSAGNLQSPILIVKSLIAGPGITIANNSQAEVMISATGLPPLVSLITANTHWAGNTTPNALPIFIAAYPLIITAIIGRVEQSSTTPATMMLVKAPNGVQISAAIAGFADPVPLTTAPLDATLAPYVNQLLPLTADTAALTLAVGDSIGVQASGTWTNAYGAITVHMAPSPN